MSKFLLFLSVAFLCSACALDGRLYTNKVVPYSEDFNQTPIGSKSCMVDDFKVKEPFTGINASAEWMTSSVYEKATEAGITKIYYADLRVFSLLGGIYSNKALIVYGD